MRNIDLIRRSGRSLLSAKTRTILTAFAISVGTFALTLTLGASNGAKNYADQLIASAFDPSELIVADDENILNPTETSSPQEYDENYGSIQGVGASRQVRMLNDNDITRLKSETGVSAVRPGTVINLQYVTRDGQKKYVSTMQSYTSAGTPKLLAGTVPSNFPAKSIVLPEGFISALGFSSAHDAVGKTVRIAYKPQADPASLLSSLRSGDTSALADATAATPGTEETFKIIAVSQKPTSAITGATGLYLRTGESDITRINDVETKGTTSYHKYIFAYVKVANGTNTTALDAAQTRLEKAGYVVQSVKDTQKQLSQIITVLQGIVSIFGLIAIVASVFGVVNTMYISVLQRTREIGLMKALGMHKKDIHKLFLFEAGLIGLIGGAAGSVAAVALGTALNPVITKQLSLGQSHLLDFKPLQLIGLVLALVIVAVLAGLLPARKASRLDPVEALRTE